MVSVKIVAVIGAIIAIGTAGILLSAESEQKSEFTIVPIDDQVSTTESVIVNQTSNLVEISGIKKITSQEDLRDILEQYGKQEGLGIKIGGSVILDSWPMGTMSSDAYIKSGETYSTTNVQVQNVDEPDYLKNDSKYVYIVNENTLTIIDAYPAEDAKLILKIALDIPSQSDDIENIFLNGDRLVMFYSGYNDEEIIPQYDFVPKESSVSVTHVLVVDVSDKKNPTILRDYSADGYFADARMIDDYVYLITNSYLSYQDPRLPVIQENSITIMTPDVFYFDDMEQPSSFSTLTAIEIFGDKINSESFLMDKAGTFYVSEDNFYLAYQKRMSSGFYEKLEREGFVAVVVPLLPENIREQIAVKLQDPQVRWIEISELMQEAYSKMSDDAKNELFDEIDEALDMYETEIKDTSHTVIHKISTENAEIKYVANGVVPGRLLNQFSMDQEGDRFRVATTVDYYSENSGTIRANSVYVLDEQLEIVGGLDEIAPNEDIFSARFIGDRLYLVTFRQIDPFFVIDLSSDTPKMLGELKIPGFSTYLHPYDKDNIIGIGRDTDESFGRVVQLGIKIALFNVSDVSNPRVSDEVVIGEVTTESEALYDHKAFFFDKQSNTLAIPITSDVQDLDKRFRMSDGYWGGFYVFDLDDSDGFDLRGTITHSKQGYYDMDYARTFYIDNVLYTVSEGYLKMNSLDELSAINSIRLDGTGKFISLLQ